MTLICPRCGSIAEYSKQEGKVLCTRCSWTSPQMSELESHLYFYRRDIPEEENMKELDSEQALIWKHMRKRYDEETSSERLDELSFCSCHCPYYGEPNGCNRPGGECKAYRQYLELCEMEETFKKVKAFLKETYNTGLEIFL